MILPSIIFRNYVHKAGRIAWKRFRTLLIPSPETKSHGNFAYLHPPKLSRETIKNLSARHVTIFGHDLELPKHINWHYDPLSTYTWDKSKPSTVIHFLNAPKADVKVVWELSRFQHFPMLAAAFKQTHDKTLLNDITSQFESWVEQNPLGFGVHWVVPMEASIRAINWITTLVLLDGDAPESLVKSMLCSLSEHAAFIFWNIEFGKKNGNHYLSNGMGLLWLGIFLNKKNYTRKGVSIVEESMREQVYDDGVDYEKSTSYHRFVMEMFDLSRQVCEANEIKLSRDFYYKFEAMKNFLASATKPNGDLCNIGDDDSGTVLDLRLQIADLRLKEEPLDLRLQIADLRLKGVSSIQNRLSSIFKRGGFASLQHQNTHLFFDFGDIGMQGYGGHGHNDTLSFELFFGGKSLIVDSGTFNYTLFQEERQKFRSIESHNTIQVDGKELVQFRNLWSITKDTTQPKLLSWSSDESHDEVSAEINNNGITHRRTIWFNKGLLTITILDMLNGVGKHSAVSRLHFHPNCSPKLHGHKIVVGNTVIAVEGATHVELKESLYSNGYYQKTTNIKAEMLIEFENDWRGTITISQQ